MSKITRRWIETSWEQPGALRGIDIPYSDSLSITHRIDQIKDSTDQTIIVDEILQTPQALTAAGKIYVKDGNLYYLDKYGNEINISFGDFGNVRFEYIILSDTDISNGYRDLSFILDNETDIAFSIIGGTEQMYNTDFVVLPDSNNNLKRLVWKSSYPSGPLFGLTDILETGDIIRVIARSGSKKVDSDVPVPSTGGNYDTGYYYDTKMYVDITVSENEQINPTQAFIFRISGDSTGPVHFSVQNYPDGQTKEITLIGSSEQNYTVLTGSNVEYITPHPDGFTLTKGSVIKLLWLEEISKWQETYSIQR